MGLFIRDLSNFHFFFFDFLFLHLSSASPTSFSFLFSGIEDDYPNLSGIKLICFGRERLKD